MTKRAMGAVLALSWLTGCLAPKYVQPEAPVSEQFPVQTVSGESVAELGWREFFPDPRLQRLISTALTENRDLQVAALNVERAEAMYRVRLSEFVPKVSADASINASKQVFGPGLQVQGTVYRAGLTAASYELDLFGRVRYQSQSALRQYLATAEGMRATQISLVSGVARAWLAERSLAEQRDLARASRDSRQTSLDLMQQRYETGLANELDLSQAQSLVAQAAAAAASAEAQHASAVQALTLLVGAPLDGELAGGLAQTGILTELPAGLPSELLEARPDLRAAEHRLRAAYSDVGAARASFFPRLSLTASMGTASSDLTTLFGPGAGVWSLAPAVTQPLTALPGLISSHKVAQVDRRIAIAQYEKAVQTAFREVATGLLAKGPLDEQVVALEALEAAQSRRAGLAEARYQEGLSSYLEFLDAERAQFDAQRSLILAREARLSNAVSLYAALGGGVVAKTGAEPGK